MAPGVTAGRVAVSLREYTPGAVGLRLFGGDELDGVATVRIDGGLGTGLYLVRNPHKLGRVGETVELAR